MAWNGTKPTYRTHYPSNLGRETGHWPRNDGESTPYQPRIARRAMTAPTAIPVTSPAIPTAGAVIFTTRRAVR